MYLTAFLLIPILLILLVISLFGIPFYNFLSLPGFLFSLISPLLIQLSLKGSSLPFFLEKYNDWEKVKYSIIIYRNSLFLSIFVPLTFVILLSQQLGKDGASDAFGLLIAISIITNYYLLVFLILLNIYAFFIQYKNKDNHFVYSHKSTYFFSIASLCIINSVQIILFIATSDDNYTFKSFIFGNINDIFTNVSITRDIIITLPIVLSLTTVYTILNKFFNIKKYFSLSKSILMNLPLCLMIYLVIEAMFFLTNFGSDYIAAVYRQYLINTLQLSIRFILGFTLILVFQILNEDNKQKIVKFDLVNKSKINLTTSGILVLLFFGGLMFMHYQNNTAISMSYIYGATIISIIPIYIARQNNKIELLIQSRTELIKSEKESTEKILYNVLPQKIALELNESGNVSPKGFNEVSILFTDFKNFTNSSSTMSPEKLVKELNTIFHSFDNVIEKMGVEKIKTIGDSYMVASGVPNSEINHAEKCIETGFEMIKALKKINKDKGIKWDIRIGIHSGRVVAGLVGKNRITYDLWGDTVNIASRMESSSDANKINVSGVTHDHVKDIYDFDYRGKIDIKGKGKVDMYFVKK